MKVKMPIRQMYKRGEVQNDLKKFKEQSEKIKYINIKSLIFM